MSRHGEHGSIKVIDESNVFIDLYFSWYGCGKYPKSISEELVDREVRSATASGSWGRMDYIIKLKEEIKNA